MRRHYIRIGWTAFYFTVYVHNFTIILLILNTSNYNLQSMLLLNK